jgi:hypothetical protein
MQNIKMVDVEALSVEFPDREGWNCVLTFTDIAGNELRVSLSTSATEDLRKGLGKGPLHRT